MGAVIPTEQVQQKILLIRGQKVMLDSDLARLYGVGTRALNQAVRRNKDRFPVDFMFQLTTDETKSLRSQIVILKLGRGEHSKYLPCAFTNRAWRCCRASCGASGP